MGKISLCIVKGELMTITPDIIGILIALNVCAIALCGGKSVVRANPSHNSIVRDD